MYVMMTVPRKYIKNGKQWTDYFRSQDIHKWILALEHGAGGLEHWQVRFKPRIGDTKQERDDFFKMWKARVPEVHMEFTENWCDYERKEGFFVTSEDTKEILKVRFGQPNKFQRQITHDLKTQSVREIDVYLDPSGRHGKSWYAVHMYEKGKAFLVYAPSGKQISADICSGYNNEGIIIIDIPRDERISTDFYGQIERIKDGIVHDSRYSNHTRNIRGAKLVIFTNKKLNEKKLSKDRWRLHGIPKGELLP